MKIEWTSVNSSLPDYDKQVLIWCDGQVLIAQLYKICPECCQEDHFTDGFLCMNLDIAAHWMFLPKGPTPKEKEIRVTTKKRRPLNNKFNTSLKKKNNFNFWG